jgi:L-alanine-DL-glutamate epimerase-like enolase superfamily enzyme
MALLVRKGAIPVVADESLWTARDALRLRDAGAAHGFNLKLAKSGIVETRRIMAVADAAGIPYGLGTMLETGLGTLANVHFAATLRAPLFPAEAVGPWMVRDDVSGVRLARGSVELSWLVPSGPGWGGSL